MATLLFIGIGVLLVVAQTTLMQPHVLWSASPDLYFILIAFLAFRIDLFRSVIIIFAISLPLDALSGIYPGFNAVFCFAGYFLLRFASQHLAIKESIYKIPLVGVGYLVVSGTLYLLLTLAVPGAAVQWSWPRLLMRAGLIVLLAQPLLAGFNLVNRIVERPSFIRAAGLRSGNRFR